jgi:hypothetical protein
MHSQRRLFASENSRSLSRSDKTINRNRSSKHLDIMSSKDAATGATTIALLVIISVLIGALGVVLLSPQSVIHPVTTTFTRTAMLACERNYTATTMEPGRLSVTTSPFCSSLYLSNASACTEPSGYSPCFDGPVSDAYVFNCAIAAASPSGCTQHVVSSLIPSNSYAISISFPYINQTSSEPSWANCMFDVNGKYNDGGGVGVSYAYCISVSSTAFILSEEAPPPL